MSLYKRGGVWWYEFVFGGQRIRRSTKTGNKEVAKRAESERLRSLQMGANGLQETRKPLLFSLASKNWIEFSGPHWSANNSSIVEYNLKHLSPHFGAMMLADIKGEHISRYQASRLKEKAAPKTINLEVGTLRAIMRKNRLWANIQPDVRMLKARTDVGRALSDDEFHRVLIACKNSGSRSLYPAVLVSLHTGLRNGELRLLRWRQVDLLDPKVTVGKSKTAGGEGRIVPLSKTALQCLMDWRSLFPNALPGHFVFPSERYRFDDDYETGKMVSYEVKPTIPIGSWKTAWRTARTAAKVECRWHDMRREQGGCREGRRRHDHVHVGPSKPQNVGAVLAYPKRS